MVAGPTPNMGHDPKPRRKPGPQGKPIPRAAMVKPPFIFIALLMVAVVASWLPLVFIARGRVNRSPDPRIHLVQDMGTQPKYMTETASDVFADGREMRPRIPGTVQHGQLQDDDHYYRGFSRNAADGKITFFDTFPQQITLNETTLHRGQERFNIYCSVCHGLDGMGNGQINARAQLRQEGKWVQPANLHTDVVKLRPDGHLFNTITNGIRNMAGYGAQIPVEDRWAIVAYLRALQTSQASPATALNNEQLDSLR